MTSQPWHDISRASVRATPCVADATKPCTSLGAGWRRAELGPSGVAALGGDLEQRLRSPRLLQLSAVRQNLEHRRLRSPAMTTTRIAQTRTWPSARAWPSGPSSLPGPAA